MEDGNKSRIWARVEERVPAPVSRCCRKIVKWTRGPEPPKIHHVTPVFERAQTLCVRLLAPIPLWTRLCILILAFVLWAVLFGVLLSKDSLPKNIAGFGAPVRLSCVTSLWPSPQSCGLDGRNCLPFSNASFAFSCPADCRSAQVLNPRAIGDLNINYRSLVVGGADIYRGDSFICTAAIHAGVMDNKGGCGVLSLVGEKSGFQAMTRNGIASVGFNASFPMAFEFNQSEAVATVSAKCHDPRWNTLALSTVFTAVFGVFTSNAAAFFAPVFTILFFQIGMASDPPPYNDYPSLASTTIGRFLPAALVAALFYQFSVRRALRNCNTHIEKTVLWIGGAWVGALGNYTFERIPIQRLTSHDIHQQPGAITALVIIVLVLFVVLLYQAWCLRLEGRFPHYLALYISFGIGLGILAAMPRLTLRIHHYIIALLLLPGTALQTRISFLCQGILVGLFINGIARWGFDAVLQTAASLRGDALLGSGIPSIFEPILNGSSITFTWKGLIRSYQGVSVLVNDVERFMSQPGELNFTWTRQATDFPEFYRFGFFNYLPFGGLAFSDFTRAGTWWPNGTWSGIPPGRT